MFFRRCPRTPPSWMSECPPGDCTARRTGDMSSGTSCSYCPASPCTSRKWHGAFSCTGTVACPRPVTRPAGRVCEERCSPGRAAVRAPRRRRRCIATPLRPLASRPLALAAPRRIGHRLERVAVRAVHRRHRVHPGAGGGAAARHHAATGAPRPPTTPIASATASAVWWARTNTTTPTPGPPLPASMTTRTPM